MPDGRPNILLIMSDEHDPNVTGCYADPVVQTPRLDRLAAEGVTFDACYTTSPLCVPARLSFTAGKYVSNCGAWSNSCRLPSADYPSLPRQLEAAGCEAYLCGKMHYDRHRRYGFRDLIPDDGCNSGIMSGKLQRRAADDLAEDADHRIWGWQKRIDQFFVGDEHESHVMVKDVQRTDTAIRFLQERKPGDKPFFLSLGLLSPHFPLIVPQRFYDAVKGKVPMPSLPEDWWQRLPLNYKHLIRGFGVDHENTEILRKGRELYWAFVGWMDEQIGRVLDALATSAAADNTIVIYTSDHGENKGDHGMWWKNNMYDHAARIPLIVHCPKRWRGGQRRAGACSLLDVTKTILALQAAEAPQDWSGDSLVEYLDNPDSEWKDTAVSEYYAHNIASGFAMIRQGQWKYVYHTRSDADHSPERELYDLENDPEEWNNRAADPAQQNRVAAMHAALVAEVGRDPEEAEAECRHDHTIGYADVS